MFRKFLIIFSVATVLVLGAQHELHAKPTDLDLLSLLSRKSISRLLDDYKQEPLAVTISPKNFENGAKVSTLHILPRINLEEKTLLLVLSGAETTSNPESDGPIDTYLLAALRYWLCPDEALDPTNKNFILQLRIQERVRYLRETAGSIQKHTQEMFQKLELESKNSDFKVIVVGHSLGGFFAQILALQTGIEAVTFNAPGAVSTGPIGGDSAASEKLPIRNYVRGAGVWSNISNYLGKKILLPEFRYGPAKDHYGKHYDSLNQNIDILAQDLNEITQAALKAGKIPAFIISLTRVHADASRIRKPSQPTENLEKEQVNLLPPAEALAHVAQTLEKVNASKRITLSVEGARKLLCLAVQMNPDSATDSELRNQAKRLYIRIHPDKNPENSDLASETFGKLRALVDFYFKD